MLPPAARLPDNGLMGFADIDALGDASGYIEFLDAFQHSGDEMIGAGIEALNMARGASVLDVGCGHGAAFDRLAEKVGPTGRVVGIDASRSLVDEARRRWSDRTAAVEVLTGDARRLPFADACFDAVRADRVLLFVPQPEQALGEMARVARPGARIVVTEADLGCTAIDSGDMATTRAVLAENCDALVNGQMGRRLRGLFVDQGLLDVEIAVFGMHSTNFDEWRRRFGAAAALQRAVARGTVTVGAADAWWADLEQRHAAGRFYASSLFFMCCASKGAT